MGRIPGAGLAAVVGAAAFFAATGASAQSSGDAAELAKQLANPVASLVSVPLQFNWDGGIGSQDADRYTLNVQPVVPIDLTEDLNLISRTILPVVSLEAPVAGADDAFGLGDVLQSLFFSPKAPGAGGLIWGVGPAFLLPTATDDALGAGKLGAGPTAVGLIQRGPWTFGALANHIWSFAGEDGADVNATFAQPFVNYTTAGATSFFLNTEASYDWEGGAWSVPINAGVNQLVGVGAQRIQIGAGLRYWAEAPDAGPEGLGVRLNLVFLFPKGG
ncbi:hypothetical protein [Rubrimonas cliftonensis]|uniref:MetA-pathway of phenol degradation n=1 Tax=Rubrimonas cliftonensis TaxID=89524 RepID=A0A1H3YQP6_9RHOB|nr:hypothetical protein [Rubrimonas cliftonensis]SEA13501.1 hypothetical protein SAMN05444370_103193 [Rubrimonas cliftonensis]